MSNSLWPHELQHTRPPCPSPSPGFYTNSCPLSWWCHLTILSSVVPLFLLPSIFPSIRVFSSESTLSIWWSKYWSFSFSPSNEYSGLISLRLTGLISLQSKGLSKVFSNTTICKHQFSGTQPSLWSNSHIHTWLLEKPQLQLYGPWSAQGHLCFLRTSFPCSEETWSLVIKRMLLDPTPSWFGAPGGQPPAWRSVTRS